MRRLALVLVASFAASSAYADEHLDIALQPPRPAAPSRDVTHAVPLRDTGIVMTVLGTLGVVVGAVVLTHGAKENSDGGIIAGVAGMAIVTISGGGVIAGVPMWAVGGVRAARADEVRVGAGASGLKVQF